MNLRTTAFRFLPLFFCSTVTAQIGVKWQAGFGPASHVNAAQELPGGGFAVAGDSIFDAFLARTDPNGQLLWKKTLGSPNPFAETFRSVQQLADGGLFAVGERLQTLSGDYDFYAARTDASGDTLWTKTFGGTGSDFAAKGQPTADGGFILCGRTNSTDGDIPLSHGGYDIFVMKLDENGSVSWTKTFGGTANDFATGIRQTADGGFLIFGTTFSNDGDVTGSHGQSDAWLLKIDAAGALVFQKTFGGTGIDAGYDLTGTADENLALVGQAYSLDGDLVGVHSPASASDGWLLKTTPDGSILWQKCLRENAGFSVLEAVVQLASGGFAVTGNFVQSLSAILDGAGNLLWQPDFGGVGHSQALCPTADGGFAIDFQSNTLVRFVAPHLLSGHVFRDENSDCAFQNATEIPLFKRLLRAEKAGSPPVFFQSKFDGSYSVILDTGAWTVRVFGPSEIWGECPPVVKNFDLTTVAAVADFGLQPLGDCPLMAVDLATDVIRPCFSSHYTAQYCNIGTVKADSARLEILLDDWLAFQNPSQPPSNVSGQKITFSLGDVGAGDCGTVQFDVAADCDSVLVGQYKCVEARVFPDSFCVAPVGWSGGALRLDGFCNPDSVRFQATNIGFGPTVSLEYVIIEDEVLTRQGIVPPLNPGGVFTPPAVPRNGSTWRMLAGQEPNTPSNSQPTAVVEGCGTNGGGTFSVGLANNFPEDDGLPSVDVDCRQTVAAFDPNTKANSPQGVGFQYFTQPGTDLEYTIQFQNTGSFFATDITLLDTLDVWLDPSTLRFGTASHYPLDWGIAGPGILKISFDNIQLPYAALDEAASHGWAHFRVSHKKDIPLGTVIPNRAGIYFDFNPVVLTPPVYNTIDTGFLEITISTGEVGRQMPLRFFPNPVGAAGELFFIEEEGLDGATFRLFDVAGRPVFSQKLEGDGRVVLPVSRLAIGLYSIEILDRKGRRVGAGKLVR